MRATPLLAQLYFLYFGLPRLGIVLPEFVVGILALSLNSGAYVAEIIRAGILSIPRGQVEAGVASGMTYAQRMRLVILPQAFKVTIPPLLGQAIVLVKDSALLSLISVVRTDARRPAARLRPLHAGGRLHHHRRLLSPALLRPQRTGGAVQSLARLAAGKEQHMIWQQLQSLVGSYPLALARPRHDRHAVADQPGAGHG